MLLKCLLGYLLGEVSVNLADVFFAAHFRDERRLYALSIKILPVDIREKGMCLDLLCIQPLGWVSLEQVAKEILRIL